MNFKSDRQLIPEFLGTRACPGLGLVVELLFKIWDMGSAAPDFWKWKVIKTEKKHSNETVFFPLLLYLRRCGSKYAVANIVVEKNSKVHVHLCCFLEGDRFRIRMFQVWITKLCCGKAQNHCDLISRAL